MNPHVKWQREMAQKAFGSLAPVLNGRRRLRDINQAVDQAHHAASEVQRGLLDRRSDEGNPPPDCKAGCDHCCRIRVRTTVAEVVRLADWLMEQHDGDELENLRTRLAEHCAEIDALEGVAYFETPVECALLVNHLCSVHTARPLPCRAYISWSADACYDHFRLRKPSQIPTMPAMAEMMMPIAEGLGEAAHVSKAGPKWVSLPHALLIALTPGSIREWQSGAPVFEPARARDLPPEMLVKS